MLGSEAIYQWDLQEVKKHCLLLPFRACATTKHIIYSLVENVYFSSLKYYKNVALIPHISFGANQPLN